MMKKLLSIVLAVLMTGAIIITFAGCSNSDTKTNEASSDTSDDTAVAQTVEDLDAVKDAGKIVVGITDYEPMDYQNDSGEWVGFDADLVNAVAEKLGVDVEFVLIEWDNKFTELNAKSIDCIWNGMTVSDSVKTNCDISTAYATNSQVVVMKENALSNYADSAALKDADLTIAVEKGSAGEAEAKNITDTSKIVALTAQSDALKEVKAGTADACIIDSTMANSMTKDGTDFSDLGYSVSLTTEEYAAGFRKGSDLTAEVNRILEELKADGTLTELSEKYGVNLAE